MDVTSHKASNQNTDLYAYKRAVIAETIQHSIDKLFKTICIYVRKSHVASGEEISKVATECLSEVVERGLRNADRFDLERSAEAWLLGIAAKVILQLKYKQRRDQMREPFLHDLFAGHSIQTLDEHIGQHFPNKERIDDQLASKDHANKLMSYADSADRQLIYLSVIEQHSAKEIAERLGSTPGAIRVRLFRALKRLRKALETHEAHELLAR